MSQSQSQVGTVTAFDRPASELKIVESESTVRELLNVLSTDDCRAIFDATNDDALSASEISDRCELPLSTVYRKLNVLAEEGLLEERIRISRSGKHVSEYIRLVEDVVISVSPSGGLALQISRRERPESRPVLGFETERN